MAEKPIVYTRTHTATIAYKIGDDLASKDPSLREVADQMNAAEQKYADDLLSAGLELEATDDPNKLQTIRFQWQRIVNRVIPNNDVGAVHEWTREGVSSLIAHLLEDSK